MTSARVFLFTALLTAIAAPTIAGAQAYPDRPIKLIVPFAPGSSPDLTARLVGERAARLLGQAIVIENRPGAGGNIGVAAVARAAPDGYTLLSGGSGTHAANPALYATLPFDPIKDFDPVIDLYTSGLAVIVKPDSGIAGIKDLAAKAKTSPGGELRFGVPHSSARLAMEALRKGTGLNFVPVNYVSNGDAMLALLRGDIHMLSDTVTVLAARAQSGETRAIGVPMKERSRALPNVPTFIEQGVSADLLTWTALFAPKGTPRDIVNRLNTVVNQVLKEPEVLAVFNRNALQAAGGTPEQLEAKLASEIVRWRTMIREAGLTAQ